MDIGEGPVPASLCPVSMCQYKRQFLVGSRGFRDEFATQERKILSALCWTDNSGLEISEDVCLREISVSRVKEYESRTIRINTGVRFREVSALKRFKEQLKGPTLGFRVSDVSVERTN